MSEEIKEILDELESLFEISEAPEHIINGFNKLKDYITNLQERVEQLLLENEQLRTELNTNDIMINNSDVRKLFESLNYNLNLLEQNINNCLDDKENNNA